MNCPLEVKNLFVSSNNRDVTKNPYGNSYTLYLTNPIKDITNVELLYAAVPNTMYNLINGSQVLSFNSNTYSLPSGFYGAYVLSTEIQNTEFSVENVTVTYLPGEGMYRFASDSYFTMTINTEEMCVLLGFTWSGSPYTPPTITTSGTQYATNPTYKNYYIKSTTIVDLNNHEGVFLDIEELRTVFNECAAQGQPYNTNSQTASRSFGIIPMDVNGGVVKVFKKESDYDNSVEYMYPIKRLDRVTVNWVDRNGHILNFNGYNDNSFLLRFHTLRKNLC